LCHGGDRKEGEKPHPKLGKEALKRKAKRRCAGGHQSLLKTADHILKPHQLVKKNANKKKKKNKKQKAGKRVTVKKSQPRMTSIRSLSQDEKKRKKETGDICQRK